MRSGAWLWNAIAGRVGRSLKFRLKLAFSEISNSTFNYNDAKVCVNIIKM